MRDKSESARCLHLTRYPLAHLFPSPASLYNVLLYALHRFNTHRTYHTL